MEEVQKTLDGFCKNPSPSSKNDTHCSSVTEHSQSRPYPCLAAKGTSSGDNTKVNDDEEERRVRRIFIHLQALCITDEAKSSLSAFREVYERKTVGRP